MRRTLLVALSGVAAVSAASCLRSASPPQASRPTTASSVRVDTVVVYRTDTLTGVRAEPDSIPPAPAAPPIVMSAPPPPPPRGSGAHSRPVPTRTSSSRGARDVRDARDTHDVRTVVDTVVSYNGPSSATSPDVIGRIVLTTASHMRAFVDTVATVAIIPDTVTAIGRAIRTGGVTDSVRALVTPVMRAVLVGNGFLITSPDDSIQPVVAGAPTVWTFHVTPVASGHLMLYAHVSAQINAAGEHRFRANEAEPLSVEVESNAVGYAAQAWRDNRAALVAFALPVGGLGGVLTWLVSLRRGSKKKAEAPEA